MTLQHRITRLEGSLRDQDTIRETDISTDSLISKLGLDPEVVRATARANGQPIARPSNEGTIPGISVSGERVRGGSFSRWGTQEISPFV